MALSCMVCFEQLFQSSDEVDVGPCGHFFHHKCWEDWLHRSNNCPKCRTDTASSQLIRLFFNTGEGDDYKTLRNMLDCLKCDFECKVKECENAEESNKILSEEISELRLKSQLRNEEYVGLLNVLEQSDQRIKELKKGYEEEIRELKRQQEGGEAQRSYSDGAESVGFSGCVSLKLLLDRVNDELKKQLKKVEDIKDFSIEAEKEIIEEDEEDEIIAYTQYDRNLSRKQKYERLTKIRDTVIAELTVFSHESNILRKYADAYKSYMWFKDRTEEFRKLGDCIEELEKYQSKNQNTEEGEKSRCFKQAIEELEKLGALIEEELKQCKNEPENRRNADRSNNEDKSGEACSKEVKVNEELLEEEWSPSRGAEHKENTELKINKENLEPFCSKDDVEELRKLREKVEGLMKCMDQNDQIKKSRSDSDALKQYRGLYDSLWKYTYQIVKDCKDEATKAELTSYYDPSEFASKITDWADYLDYFEESKQYIEVARDLKKYSTEDSQGTEQFERCPRGCILHLFGFPESSSGSCSGLTALDIHECVSEMGANVAFVMYNRGDKDAYVRITGCENQAVELLQTLPSGLLTVANISLNARVLEGEEETLFLRRTFETAHRQMYAV